MKTILYYQEKVCKGQELSKQEVYELLKFPLEELCKSANEVREVVCGDIFDICTIVNGKSGKCSEDCKFCAQSAFYHTEIEEYPLLDSETILEQAKYNDDKGVLRYSIVTSGKKLSNNELEIMCENIIKIKETTNIDLCVSFGLLNKEQFELLKSKGVSRIHNNLETSRKNFPNICTTHTFDDKIRAIKAAQEAGLVVCSGGIMGLGESMEDRIDMAFTLRDLGVQSVPINLLNPIPGTPFGKETILNEDEIRQIVAIYRFILPSAFIRLAGGRGLLKDKGKSCFLSGANAVISGDMLTTSGISIDTDMALIKSCGYKVGRAHE